MTKLFRSLAPLFNKLDRYLRRLFMWAVVIVVLFALSLAVRGDWGIPVTMLAIVLVTILLTTSLLVGGFLLGVSAYQRIKSDVPVVGALPDVVQAIKTSAQIAAGDNELLVQPGSDYGEDEEMQTLRDETEATHERAMQLHKQMMQAAQEDQG